MARRKSTAGETHDELSFEDALASLEAVVDSMEQEQLPLEELVTQYEKGSQLLLHCELMLKSARERIDLITLQARKEIPQDGEIHAPASIEVDASDDDDIRLF